MRLATHKERQEVQRGREAEAEARLSRICLPAEAPGLGYQAMCAAMAVLAVLVAAVIILSRSVFVGWLRQRCRSRLPPGTMGWPLVGETLQLFSQDPAHFFQTKQKRFGEVFKTHLLGSPAVMLASPEAIKFVLSQDDVFRPTFPATKQRILGRQALNFHDGDYHMRIRRLAVTAFRPESIRNVVPGIEALALAALAGMESQPGQLPVNAFKELKGFTFDVASLLIFGGDVAEEHRQELKGAYYVLDAGYNSFPLNFPGTRFHKALQARRRVEQIIASVMAAKERGSSGSLLSTFMESENDNSTSAPRLTQEQIVDNVIGLLFAAHGTTAAVMTWLLKYLADSPAVLQTLTAEQEGIAKSKVDGQTGLTWLDTKNAPFTSKVIQETLRLSTILSFTYREAVRDVEYKGYVFPKGWKVMPLFRNLHHNSKLFANPQMFQPDRFEKVPRTNSFMPFGQGVHSCLGSELAKLEMHVFIHHLTTKYRWETVATAGGVTYSPFPVPKDGLPVKMARKSEESEPVLLENDHAPKAPITT